jgi:hypothetical protein
MQMDTWTYVKDISVSKVTDELNDQGGGAIPVKSSLPALDLPSFLSAGRYKAAGTCSYTSSWRGDKT